MSYAITYTALCNRGKIRAGNQDNFWCEGHYLECVNDGLDMPVSGTAGSSRNPMLAVFDGMGGEKHGETAAYLAAKTLDEEYNTDWASNAVQFMTDICYKINKVICSYTEEKRSGDMGTTAAITGFSNEGIHICNIGDSKIFRYSNKKLMQISYDHVMKAPGGRKPVLSQCLGIPEDDFIIEPYTARIEFQNCDRYLLSSDGLTDMVAAEEIERILVENEVVSECAGALMRNALQNGGNDNITIILCEVRDYKRVK